MDFEKVYKAALETAAQWIKDGCTDKEKICLEGCFPELRESEDEKIRKQLINEVKEQIDNIPAPDCCNSDDLKRLAILESWITYLEKQRTSKEALVYLKEHYSPAEVSDFQAAMNIAIAKAYDNGRKDALEKQKDQDVKVISWREPDDCADIPEGHYVVIAYKPGVFGLGYIGNGKVVCAPGQKPSGILYIPNADESIIVESKEQKLSTEETELNSIAFLEQMGYTCIPPGKEQKPVSGSSEKPNYHAEWSEDTLDEFTNNIRALITDKLTSKTKCHDGSEMSFSVFIDDKTAKDIANGILFYVGKEAVNNPNKEIPEWSEEDESYLQTVISEMEANKKEAREYEHKTYDAIILWLKSLHPQSHWKPSEEQMEALMLAIEGKCPPTSYMSRRLEDLYEGLVNTFKVECKLDE